MGAEGDGIVRKIFRWFVFVLYCFTVYWIVSPVSIRQRIKTLWRSRHVVKKSWDRVREA